MRLRTFRLSAASLAVAFALSGCGGGGGAPGDTKPGQDFPPPPAVGPDSFLLFPNPQLQADGTVQTNTVAYAEAYYRAIDPQNARDTLAKWKAANGWDTGTGTQITVVFGDRRDLGYGRHMHARRNPDGTLAFYVENYLIQAGPEYAYSPLNLDAAIVEDTRWIVGINAIEFSPGPNGGVPFAKFFNFNPAGARQVQVDLDAHGLKAMPGPCISCHGGRGDALTPPDSTGLPRFNLVQNGAAHTRGDVQAHMHPFEPDAFDFTTTRAGFTRPEQEAAIKTINTWLLCTYPIAAPSSAPEDACRRPAIDSEWTGTEAALIKNAYGGDGLPNATFNDDYVPPSWLAAGQQTLYKEVVATSCRTCHGMRGTAAQSDIDFTSYEKFAGYSDRIKAHVIDRGNMPLAKIVYDAFWSSPTRPQLLANFLEGQGYTVRDSAGAILRPGRPVADPGPDRVVLPGATPLSAAGSLYATGYAWTLVSGPAGATLANASTASATFNASAAGTYVVQLVASDGSAQSAPAQLRIVVDPALSPAPSAVRFADIKAVMQTPTLCVSCHSPTGNLPHPPVFYSNEDRNGDGSIDATDELWLYTEVRSRINFTNLVASPLLRKPSGHHHKGALIQGFNSDAPPGDPTRARYDLFLNWILNGAPQ
jgi:mono/diheme cytochrome c family protein